MDAVLGGPRELVNNFRKYRNVLRSPECRGPTPLNGSCTAHQCTFDEDQLDHDHAGSFGKAGPLSEDRPFLRAQVLLEHLGHRTGRDRAVTLADREAET